MIHTSPDAPAVDVLLNASAAIEALDYAKSSGYANVNAGTYEVSVEAITPAGNSEVINVAALQIAADSRTTVVAVGTVAQEATDIILEAITVEDSAATPGNNEVAIRVLHASPAASALGSVDIYVTAPDADLATATPVTLAYKEDTDLSAVPAGSYQIRITPNGDASTILYDSGSVDLSGFGGEKLLISAINTATDTTSDATNGAPVKLLVATDSSHLVLLDDSTRAGARVIHLSPDAATAAGGNVEVFATAGNNAAIELINAFGYIDVVPSSSTYVGVEAASYVFDVAPNTDSIGDSVYQSSAINLEQGAEYTVIAAGYVSSTPAFTLLATGDNNRSIATQVSVKVVHAAAAVGMVDVYVTAADAVSVGEIEGGTAGTPLLSDFNFGAISDYVAVAEGTYDIRVLDQASSTVVIDVEDVALSNGNVCYCHCIRTRRIRR